jgi:drug/metabolite transporter (DMT)-like permease
MKAVLLAAAGLGVFVVVSAPSAGREAGLGARPLVLILGCLAAAGVALAGAQRILHPTRRAFCLGTAAGIFFALVAVLLKISLDVAAADGATALLTTWPVYALAVAGLGGVMCNQLAYRSARLSSSMPVLNAVDCLVAVTFGYVLFHEVPRHSTVDVLLEAAALAALVSALWWLARDAASDMVSGTKDTVMDAQPTA